MFSRFSRQQPLFAPIQRTCSFALCLVLIGLLAACGQNTSTTTKPSAPVYDVYGTPVAFSSTAPKRIISLSPSMGEIVGGLHLDSRVVAVDYYTTYPTDLTTRPKISDVNGNYNLEQIIALKPDLILSDGGLTKTVDGQLKAQKLDIVDLPGTSLDQVLQKILVVGRLTMTQDTAQALVKQLQQRISSIEQAVAGTTAPTVMLEVDDSVPGKPYVFGGGSFGDELIQDARGVNLFHTNSSGGGYPQVTDEAIIAANPQFIILTEDPAYGGNPALVYQRPHWNVIQALTLHHVDALNVNLMQHPSQRLVDGLRCLAQILHPTKFSGSLPADCTATV